MATGSWRTEIGAWSSSRYGPCPCGHPCDSATATPSRYAVMSAGLSPRAGGTRVKSEGFVVLGFPWQSVFVSGRVRAGMRVWACVYVRLWACVGVDGCVCVSGCGSVSLGVCAWVRVFRVAFLPFFLSSFRPAGSRASYSWRKSTHILLASMLPCRQHPISCESKLYTIGTG